MDGSPPLPPPVLERWNSYSLRTLFIAVTLLSVWVAVAVRLPWLGAILAVVAFPAVLRTAAMRRIARFQQHPWERNDWLKSLLFSLLVSWAIAVVSLVLCTMFFPVAASLLLPLNAPFKVNSIALTIATACAFVAITLVFMKLTWPKLK